jgi:putative addiction module component (TIGR02574 family)
MDPLREQVMKLPPDERRKLADEIYDSIVPDPAPFRLTEEQTAELDRRLEDFRQHPEKMIPWEEVRDRLRKIA